ncbi:MAG: hypothetical protein HC904_04455 [Blastochloris sp.]|nr:hypothetical protein [Blastochloris sp.]
MDANGVGTNQSFIELTNATNATQMVDVEGTISVLAGDGGSELAFIRSAGFDAALGLAQEINALSGLLLEGGNVAGGGNAFIDATGLQGRQSVVVQNNNLQLLGGTGAGNAVRILSAGLNGGVAGQEAQRIVVANGNLILNAGDVTQNGSTVSITQTNSGAATQLIDVDGATAGTITLTGGAGTGETTSITAAGFAAAAGISQDINALNGMGLNGGLGNSSSALVTASGLQSSQIITVQNNNLALLGGNGDNSDARILGQGLIQSISILNGNLNLTANQDLGFGFSDAIITADNNASIQTITVAGATAGLINLLGGAGNTEIAQILGNGIQSITAANGITVTGGSGTDSTALITKAGDATDTQTITVTVGNFDITGGNGTNADAIVASNGVTQTINVNNGALRVRANQDAANANADATLTATNLAAVQTLNVTNGGLIVQGGVGATELASISMTGANGRQSINLITDGDFTILGGSGTSSTALVTSAGTNGGGANQEAQRIIMDAGQLIVQGGPGAGTGATAAISQTNTNAASQIITVNGTAGTDGTVSVLGGAADNNTALITNAGKVAQTITVARGLTITGGLGDNASAGILATNAGTGNPPNDVTQTITVTTGDAILTGGDGENSDAFISMDNSLADNFTTQRINILNGNLQIIANKDAANNNSDAFIESRALFSDQVVTVSGATAGVITIEGGAGTTETAGFLSRRNQTITAANGINMTGGDGTDSNVFITLEGADGTFQLINVTNGDFNILGGTGTNADALVRTNGTLQITTVSNGNFRLQADQTNATTANADAIVEFVDNPAKAQIGQGLNVTGGVILVQGGLGQDENASIRMLASNTGAFPDISVQEIEVTNGMSVLGGAGQNSNASVISDGLNNSGLPLDAQTIRVTNGSLLVQAGSDIVDGGNASIQATNIGAATQTILVNQTISVLGGTGLDADALISSAGFNMAAGAAQAITAGTGMSVTGGAGDNSSAVVNQSGLLGTQTITITTNNLTVTGGAGDAASASINSNSSVTTAGAEGQRIVVSNGNLILTADASSVAQGGFAEINATDAAGAQRILVSNAITLTGGLGNNDFARINAAGVSQNITATGAGIALNGSVAGGANTDNSASFRSAGTQTVNWNDASSLVLNANQGDSTDGTFGTYGAGIVSVGNQNIGTSSGGAIDLNGGTTAAAAALIRSNGTQDITSRGAMTLDGGTVAVADNFALVRSTGVQNITVTTGGLTLNGNNGSSTALGGTLQAGAGILGAANQTINVNGGNANLNGGTTANSRALVEMTAAGSDQTINVTAGNLNLDDGTGADAVILSAGTSAIGQVITTSGTTNLSGTDGFQSLISGVNTVLNNNGGIWTGVANVVSTTQATVNNSGALVINESAGLTGGITGPTLVFVTGNALVGNVNAALGADTRLRTNVGTIDFQGVGTKTVNLRETDAVGLQGIVGTVNLVAGGTISNATADLTATNATLRATAGDINLNNAANSVATFNGLISDAGNITYTGDSATTFANRAASVDIGLVTDPGVQAQANITVNLSAGAMTVTAAQVLSTAGNMDYTAAGGIILAGGTKVAGTAPGAGDGLITTLGGTQTYNSAVTLNTDYLITATGAPDTINFNSTINGPGGLGIGSTPNFNGNVGATTPLAYLNLNSPVSSNFNLDNGLVVVNGSIINAGGGNFNVLGNNMTFVVDNGTVGPGAGVFTGGTMTGGGLGSLTIFAANPAGITGSAIPPTQNFLVWNGTPGGAAVLPTGFLVAVNFKAPPPADGLNDRKNKRKDIEADYTISYEEGVNAGTMVTVSGIPLAQPGVAAGDRIKIGGLLTTSYGVNSPEAINSFYFGRDVQTPVQIETDKLVNGAQVSPNRN